MSRVSLIRLRLQRIFSDDASRNARLTLCVVERAGLDAAPVIVEAGSCVINEFPVFQARGNDFPGYGIRKRDIGPDVETSPRVRPLNRTCAARIDRIEA